MSNNPGKKGKAAPWVKRAATERMNDLHKYRQDNHPAYAKHIEERKAVFKSFLPPEDETPAWKLSNKELTDANKKLKAWDKKNPSPMSFEEYVQLEKDFDAQYTPKDYS
ncbi:hypothetical protein [Phyllobacterium sp. 22552]|uniref:hypothetical protein n=1 Tax=Phyllobacterium sp. 22552 TaxID=3453941 RepID=UPI003F87AA4D